ncbi:MAG: methionine adenosyltransferase domain-containing protein [Candidatus Cloacimonadia bacterium]
MIRTAESVSPRHPDKICDRISDAILDAALATDANSRVAVETMGGHGIVTVTGEMTTSKYVDILSIVRRIAGEKYGVQVNVVNQSHEIAQGVDIGGAGDQGIMVGYACSDNESMIPQETYLSRSLCRFIYDKYPYDGKTQITLNEKGEISAVVSSFQNAESTALAKLATEWAEKEEIKLPSSGLHFNPAGDWSLGGFDADTGLTGRKLVVDNYGPRIPIGGGAFSGKDSTKVDRSGAYMARRVAVDLLRQKGAKEVYVYIAYAIGVVEPVMAVAIIDGKEEQITGYDLSPRGITEFLSLKQPMFEKTAEWGHFGNGFIWDK